MGITWRNLCLCFQKQKSEVLPREAHVALRETRGPQENSGPQNAMSCHLPMERDADESLPVSIRVMKGMETLLRPWTSSPRLCVS